MSNSLPGTRSLDSATPRNCLLSMDNVEYVSGVLDGSNAIDGANSNRTDEIRAGCFLAQNTTSKLWMPVKRSQTNGTGSSDTDVVVDDATHFKVGDVITVDAATTNTISAIDYDTNTITVGSAINWGDNAVVYSRGGWRSHCSLHPQRDDSAEG